RNTSPCSKKVVVSAQSRTDTLIVRPPWEKPSESIRVKGHGPAMQFTLALRNTLPSPASKDAEPTCALHLPSGEHGERPLHGTLPVLTTWNVFTPLPIFSVEVLTVEYLTETLLTRIVALLISASSSL